ncbi:thiaminase II/PqqC family protein [Lactobacillaceae bacterium Melli_B4]
MPFCFSGAADTGSLLNIIAALLPCPWTYSEIADYLVANGADNEANPFHEWVQFYSSLDSDQSLSVKLLDFVDHLAEQATPEELQSASQFFLKSCELEWHFWQQAFYQEDWRFKDTLDDAMKTKEEQ